MAPGAEPEARLRSPGGPLRLRRAALHKGGATCLYKPVKAECAPGIRGYDDGTGQVNETAKPAPRWGGHTAPFHPAVVYLTPDTPCYFDRHVPIANDQANGTGATKPFHLVRRCLPPQAYPVAACSLRNGPES